jgi:hypothetical protein
MPPLRGSTKGTIVPCSLCSHGILTGYGGLCPDCACVRQESWIFAQMEEGGPTKQVQPESRIKPLFCDASFRLRNCRLDVDMCIPRFTDKDQRMRQEEGGFATVTICVNVLRLELSKMCHFVFFDSVDRNTLTQHKIQNVIVFAFTELLVRHAYVAIPVS